MDRRFERALHRSIPQACHKWLQQQRSGEADRKRRGRFEGKWSASHGTYAMNVAPVCRPTARMGPPLGIVGLLRSKTLHAHTRRIGRRCHDVCDFAASRARGGGAAPSWPRPSEW